ncbi:Cadherin [Isosphaera pallida ATCC 43644]|uniref:Cadherin n=2 Tax=Isosphaera pallida TaxID=128 RepID=E8R1P1_ISOPI|nr:Cadherin [Isosphaera pallida ATCC 43644]
MTHSARSRSEAALKLGDRTRRRARRVQPTLDGLESRQLLSTTTPSLFGGLLGSSTTIHTSAAARAQTGSAASGSASAEASATATATTDAPASSIVSSSDSSTALLTGGVSSVADGVGTIMPAIPPTTTPGTQGSAIDAAIDALMPTTTTPTDAALASGVSTTPASTDSTTPNPSPTYVFNLSFQAHSNIANTTSAHVDSSLTPATEASGELRPVGLERNRPESSLNHAPAITPIPEQTVMEGTMMVVNVNVSDPDEGQTWTYALDEDSPPNATIDPQTGRITWMAQDGPSTVTFRVKVTDNDAHPQTSIATFQVHVENRPPTVRVGGDLTVEAGVPLIRLGTVSDPGNDPWTGTVDFGDGRGPQPIERLSGNQFQLRTTYDTPGRREVVVTVTDKDGASTTSRFNVTVTPPASPLPITPNPFPAPVRPVAGNATDLSTPAPRISQVMMGRASQRDRRGFVRVMFDRPVTLGTDAIVLSVGNRRLPVHVETRQAGGRTIATVTPVGGHSLIGRGAPRLVVRSALVNDAENRPLDGNGDGQAGDNFVLNRIPLGRNRFGLS